MNTVLKRKLSSVIASESIVKKIGKGKYKNFCNTTSRYKNIDNKKKDTKQKNKANHIEHCNERVNKRQKKTHYNEKMEPIRLSGNGTGNGNGSAKVKLGAVESGFLPKRIREVVWNTYNGETYSSKCYVPWCSNMINVFNYQVGHDIPESKGGSYDIGNLRPICGNCNLSMSNKWTIQEWGKLVNHTQDNSKKTEKEQLEELQKAKSNKKDLQVITPETTSNITFITFIIPNS
jgi:5-methylcytosine-specific restriction endonuclease McrA